MRLRFLLPFMALAACTAQGTQPTGGNPQVDRLAGPVSFDLSSWGRLLTHWQVNPDGTGEIWRGEGFGKGEGAVRKYRLRMDDAAMRGFVAAVAHRLVDQQEVHVRDLSRRIRRRSCSQNSSG